MNPIEEFARLKDAIRLMEERAAVLRAAFLEPGARLRSNRFEVVVRHQTRRVFRKDRLPVHILNAPEFWEESRAPVVTVREIAGDDHPAPQAIALRRRDGRPEDDLVVIEPFDALPPAPPAAFAAPLAGASGG